MEYIVGLPKVLKINLANERCVYISTPDITVVDWTRDKDNVYSMRINYKGMTEPYVLRKIDRETVDNILSELSLPLIEDAEDV